MEDNSEESTINTLCLALAVYETALSDIIDTTKYRDLDDIITNDYLSSGICYFLKPKYDEKNTLPIENIRSTIDNTFEKMKVEEVVRTGYIYNTYTMMSKKFLEFSSLKKHTIIAMEKRVKLLKDTITYLEKKYDKDRRNTIVAKRSN